MNRRNRRNDYRTDLFADLKDPDYARGYLSAAAQESPETLLLAIRDVVEAQDGMSKVAAQAQVNRENLYRVLSEEGNPRLSNLYAVLDALGFFVDIGVKGTVRRFRGAAPKRLRPTSLKVKKAS